MPNATKTVEIFISVPETGVQDIVKKYFRDKGFFSTDDIKVKVESGRMVLSQYSSGTKQLIEISSM